jgi:NADH-quinone oxidoreductase subunit L
VIALAAVAILLPFVAAFAGMLLGPRLTGLLPGSRLTGHARHAGPAVLAVAPMGVSTLLTLIVALTVWAEPGVRSGTLTLVPTGTVEFGIGLYVDGLAAVVAFMVCCVALAVQIYSVTYMAHDPRYSSYAAFISLFTAAMLLVVLSGDLIVMYVGWEVMGVCSYFLIGHHWEDRANSRAAVKAFLVTRLGDVGFLFGIFVLGLGADTFALRGVLAHDYPDGVVLAGTLLLLAGVAGKSAQFPLHTWLPDAMAGPTPISALIHAATMVAAGVYVVARLFPVFLQAPVALAVLGVMAAISMLGSALAALAQNDLKRVLAYSTISQLAIMAAALAVGSRDAAIFHLLTHGAFKALLFLAAGCVITVVGSNMLAAMGGLRHAMPVTFWSMTVGFAALAGLPPTSGFFSKDAIIEAALHALGGELIAPGAAWVVLVALLATVAVTAAYATRAWLLTFAGEARTARTEPAREAPPLMRWPVAALAVPALILGFFGLGAADLRPHFGSAAVSLLLALGGAAAAFVIWNRDPALDPARALGPLRTTFDRAFYVDEVYDFAVVRPMRALARLVVAFDHRVVDAAVEGSGRTARRFGGALRSTEGGNPQAYVTGVLAGVAVIAFVVVVLS